MASTKVGKLSVQLVTETAQFQKGMTQARKDVVAMKKEVARGTAILKKMGVALAAVGAVAAVALAAGIKSAYAYGDQLAKTGAKLGVATEALAGMHLAAERAGLSVETLNMATQRMTRRVADAAKGSGPAVQAFKDLGLSAETLNTMSPDRKLKLVLTQLQKIGNQGDKVRTAFAIFDSEGVGMINMTAEALAKAEADAKRFGTAITDLQAERIQEVNDAVNDVKKAFLGLSLDLAAKLGPAIVKISETIANAIVRFRGLVDSIDLTTVRTVAAASAFVAVLLIVPRIISAVKAIVIALRSMTVAQAIALAFGGPVGWAQLAVSVALAGGAAWAVYEAFGGLTDQVSDANDELKATIGNLDGVKNANDKLNESMRERPSNATSGGWGETFGGGSFGGRGASGGWGPTVDISPVFSGTNDFSNVNALLKERMNLLNGLNEAARNAGKTADQLQLEKAAQIDAQITKELQNATGRLSPLPQQNAYQLALNAIDMRKRRENLAALTEEMDALNKEVRDFGKSDIDLQIERFRELGATADQLKYAREQLELLQQKRNDQKNAGIETGEFRQEVISRIALDPRISRSSGKQDTKRTADVLERFLPEIEKNTRSVAGATAG